MHVSNRTLLRRVGRFVPREDILFLLCGRRGDSADIDVYCVTRRGRSQVHMFYDRAHVWNELFIDNLADVRLKLKACDEICVNFLSEMEFVHGETAAWEGLRKECLALKARYVMPPGKRFLLEYRVKCLFSKLARGGGPQQDRFIVSALTYPLLQLVYASHGIFPGSPKRWVCRLKEELSPKEFSRISYLFGGTVDRRKIASLVGAYCRGLRGFHHVRRAPNNKTSLDAL